MFDDPRRKLQWMEEELRAQEEPETDDDLMRRVDELLDEDSFTPKVRKQPADFSRTVYRDERFDETLAVMPRTQKKQKGIGGLVLLAALETAAIVYLARWWMQWL